MTNPGKTEGQQPEVLAGLAAAARGVQDAVKALPDRVRNGDK